MRYIIFILCLLSGLDVLACKCKNLKKKQLLEKAEIAVVVQVIDVFRRHNFPVNSNADVKVKVVKVIKGKVASTDIVVISSAAGECAEDFVVGRKYLVTGSDQIYDSFDEEEWKKALQEADSLTSDDQNLPVTEPYEKYITRVTLNSSVIFSDTCGVIRY